MGIRSGAEMTTFEMRFIALRCKDTIAPTGTIHTLAGSQTINMLVDFAFGVDLLCLDVYKRQELFIMYTQLLEELLL